MITLNITGTIIVKQGCGVEEKGVSGMITLNMMTIIKMRSQSRRERGMKVQDSDLILPKY
jgi:hypothetical protein